MNTMYLDNNHITLVGKVTSEKKLSHEIYGEKFYVFDLSVPRLSGNFDSIPVTISERLITEKGLPLESKMSITGQFRSYNSYEGEKNRLVLTVFAKSADFLEDQEADIPVGKDFITNEVVLDGYICRKPIYRKTPFGREIADVLLAVNRSYNKSDYIPCIAWGRNAKFCETVAVGTEIKVVGRVQSRQYEKKHEDGSIENRVAYEVSVSTLEVIEKNPSENDVVEESKEAI